MVGSAAGVKYGMWTGIVTYNCFSFVHLFFRLLFWWRDFDRWMVFLHQRDRKRGFVFLVAALIIFDFYREGNVDNYCLMLINL